MTYLARRLKLSDASIRRLDPPAPGKREIVFWDTLEAGLGIRVRHPRRPGQINATFILQRDLHGKSVKVTIGRYGPWTVDQARKRARALKVDMDTGENPNEAKRSARDAARVAEQQAITLGDAVNLHLEDMRAKERSPVSIGHMEHETEKYLSDRMRRPLLDLDGTACRSIHKSLTKAHGIYIANRVLRHVRAAWNTAARIHEHVPPRNPVKAVVFHQERERDDPIAWDDLPAWWAAVNEMRNPVLRDLQLFYLFTGLRRNDGKSVRWEHLDLNAGTVFRPNPKGGARKAFTVPVCEFVLDILRRREEENQGKRPVKASRKPLADRQDAADDEENPRVGSGGDARAASRAGQLRRDGRRVRAPAWSQRKPHLLGKAASPSCGGAHVRAGGVGLRGAGGRCGPIAATSSGH